MISTSGYDFSSICFIPSVLICSFAAHRSGRKRVDKAPQTKHRLNLNNGRQGRPVRVLLFQPDEHDGGQGSQVCALLSRLDIPPARIVNAYYSFNVHGIIYISEDGWFAPHPITFTNYGHPGRGYRGTCRTRNPLASDWAPSGQG